MIPLVPRTGRTIDLAVGERRIFLKTGEGPSREPVKAKDKGGWDTPASSSSSSPKPSPAPSKAPPKNEIPDDDRLD